MQDLSLGELQRRLAGRICDPEAGKPAAGRESVPGSVHALVRGDARAAADVRVAVYAGAYQARLRDALGRDYPFLAALLGEEGFHDLAVLYLLAFPPRRPSLRFAGDRLSTFLADHPAGDAFRRRWPFSADLARLEWSLVDAFDAPDAELLMREDLEQVQPFAFESLVFSFQPSVARLSLRWPVHRLLEPESPRAPAPVPRHPEPTELLVWRRREEPRFRPLPADEARAIDAARQGASFGALCELLVEARGPEAAPARAAAFLTAWIREGLLRLAA